MRRRIFLSIIGFVLPVVLLTGALLGLSYYNTQKNRELSLLRDSARIITPLYSGETLPDYTGDSSLQITVISPVGAVLYDNTKHTDTQAVNDGEPEFIGALRDGSGQAVRYSTELESMVCYYAVRLEDGSVLRLSRAIEGTPDIFLLSIPVLFIAFALFFPLAGFISRRLTNRLISPLTGIAASGESAAVYDELLPLARKLREQKRETDAQIAALRHRADTVAAITENMREGLILLDLSGMVLTANKSANDIFGRALQGNILHICRDLDFRRGVARCLSGESAQIIFERGGRVYDVYFSPVNRDNGGAVILLFDVTARREAENHRREFTANVSHELKTPLTSISALGEMIERGIAQGDDIVTFAARITEHSRRLISTIEDIIKLTEFDGGGVLGEREIFDIFELALSIAETLRDNSKGVTIQVTGERFEIMANRRMIDELLTNLMENGVKYNKDGGTVTVTLTLENGLCKIEVSDTGIGIPPEHHNRVFERFYRVDKSRSKKTGGTGLGLSIVKHAAERHNGRVGLESEEGRGTTVTCRIETGIGQT